jgi:L-asparaginase
VERVKNPILLAKLLQNEKDRVLSGKGATFYARAKKLSFGSCLTPKCLQEFYKKKKGKSGTVGAVALDFKGRIAAATSTGGRGMEFPFRVSDSPTVAGNFANLFAGLSATGTGEQIVEHAVAAAFCERVAAGQPPRKAVQNIIRQFRKYRAEIGFIALTRQGEYFAKKTTPHLTWAAITNGKLEIHVH